MNKLKDIYTLRKIWFAPKFIEWDKKHKIAIKGAMSRKYGMQDPNFEQIKKLQNKYYGSRCFIVATGPSLTLDDLNLIKDEICFGMNSICKVYDKTDWRPTFYGIQDISVYKKMQSFIEKYYSNSENVFVSDELKEKCEISNKWITFPFDAYYHLYDQQFGKFYSKFSPNAYEIVYDGYSITYSLIQIAIYMGFKEIYLLGTDCNYTKNGSNHFVESGHHDVREYLNHDKMITGYNAAYNYAKNNEIEIINCTRGGMLEVFPRKSLEDVLR